ncbi:unnamed protein product [Brassica rapa subsp. narinosa]
MALKRATYTRPPGGAAVGADLGACPPWKRLSRR